MRPAAGLAACAVSARTVLAAPIGLAVAVTLAGVSVLGTLVAASVIGGFGTPLGLVILVSLARDPQIMGSRPITWRQAAAGWAAASTVGGLAVLLVLHVAGGLASRAPLVRAHHRTP
jgi:Mn2+/Fe2+ NRAMP family transporter